MNNELNISIQAKLGELGMNCAEMEEIEIKEEVKVFLKQNLPAQKQVDTRWTAITK